MGIAQGLSGGFAEGGMVRGPGTGTSDSITARLSDGEHITRAVSVSRLGERFMAGINAGVVDLGALNAGATVRGAGNGAGGAGSGPGASGQGSAQHFHFAFHDDGSSAENYLKTVKGQKFLVDTSRQNVREVNGKS